MKTKYIVSHYAFNPEHNSKHEFTNYRDAQAEFMSMTGKGASWLEIEDNNQDFKRRSWSSKRPTPSKNYASYSRHYPMQSY